MAENLPAVAPISAVQRPERTLTSTPNLVIPEVPMLQKRTYASAMSYIGITRRTTAWVRKVGTTPATAIAAWVAAATFLMAMYVFLVFYYFVVFFLFGLFTIPFRLVRRSHRKQEHLQQAQLATMQAMMVAQQAALQQQPK